MKKEIKVRKATYQERIDHKVKGKNFMTPYIIEYYFIPHKPNYAQMLVEVSEGSGFGGGTIYGVTCSNNGKTYHELSKCLHSEKEVIEYINNLK
jgi:hypothetical protein